MLRNNFIIFKMLLIIFQLAVCNISFSQENQQGSQDSTIESILMRYEFIVFEKGFRNTHLIVQYKDSVLFNNYISTSKSDGCAIAFHFDKDDSTDVHVFIDRKSKIIHLSKPGNNVYINNLFGLYFINYSKKNKLYW